MVYRRWPSFATDATTYLLLAMTGGIAQLSDGSRLSGEQASQSVHTCATGDSLLDSPVTRELLRLLWVHSNSEAPPSERRERAGVLFDSAGVLAYRADLDNPNDTPCRCSCAVPVPGTALAMVMTHPFRPGDLLPAICSKGDGRLRWYDVSRLGGPSDADLSFLQQWQVLGYVVDQANIYAIPRGATRENVRSVITRYPRIDPVTRCRIM